MNAKFLVCVAAQGAQEPVRRAAHETLRIGRSRDGNDVSLPGDASLAPRHCEFFFRDNAWHVRDLDTETGTYVDRERVQEAVLVNGARVQIGIAEVVYTPEVEAVQPEPEVEAEVPRLRPPGNGETDGDEERIKLPDLAGGSGRRAVIRVIE
ncbi:MAG: FHA domain-containing protein [Lentisphaeria bacterium]|jgi:pSer/pThr/pTyr-binding forkhead associated (FHA) protein|nr:FHA domain-containing protein [Lentisphaeria bacterium]